MKKGKKHSHVVCAVICLACAFLCGCSVQIEYAGESSSSALTLNGAQQEKPTAAPKKEIRAAWVCYGELNPKKLTQEAAFRRHLQALLAPLCALRVTDVFLQVRPFADAIYPSEIYTSSASVVKRRGDRLPFDFLAVFLQEASALSLRVHAWINPYRVSLSVADPGAFKNDPAVGALLASDGAPQVLTWNGGVYLNPASEEAQSQIVDGVRELLTSYMLAGVHIDDYFYPTDDPSFDRESYAAFRRGGGESDLMTFRRENVSRLIRSLYNTVKEFGDDKIFSISPAADVEKNENVLAADVRKWASQSIFCDWLIPQLYFGLTHETMPFAALAAQWRSICTNPQVRLLAGLAAYKVGKRDAFAGSGVSEWMSDSAVLAKQTALLRKESYDGFALFSAASINFDEKLSAKAFQKLKDVL